MTNVCVKDVHRNTLLKAILWRGCGATEGHSMLRYAVTTVPVELSGPEARPGPVGEGEAAGAFRGVLSGSIPYQ